MLRIVIVSGTGQHESDNSRRSAARLACFKRRLQCTVAAQDCLGRLRTVTSGYLCRPVRQLSCSWVPLWATLAGRLSRAALVLAQSQQSD